MKLLGITALLAMSLANGYAQQTLRETTDEILRKGTIIDGNIQTAITVHLKEEPNFHPSKQMPEDKRPEPDMLVKKDNTVFFDVTPGQRARNLMEDIRQGLHALQSSEHPRALDVIALAGGREIWPKLREISCKDAPGTRYYDLDGFEQFCPDK